MNTEEVKKSAYRRVKEELDKQFASGMIPCIKGFKKVIAEYRKRIKILRSCATFFVVSLEDVDRLSLAIAKLSGELNAYQERYIEIQQKIKENS